MEQENKGFITDDFYAAVPYGKHFIVIYNGQQLELCKTEKAAWTFIKKHRQQPKTGTIFI